MRIWMAFLLTAALAAATSLPAEKKKSAAKTASSKSQSKPAAKTKAATSMPPAVEVTDPGPQVVKTTPIQPPKGAVEIEPGKYRVRDEKGQAWIYQRTPFGFMRRPEEKQQAAATAAPVIPSDWKVTEDGEWLRFEKPSPFGANFKWSKKKDDLTAEEAGVWKRVRESEGK